MRPDSVARVRSAARIAAAANAIAGVALAGAVLPAFPLAGQAARAAVYAASHGLLLAAGWLVAIAGSIAWCVFLWLLPAPLPRRTRVVLGALVGAAIGPDVATQAWAALRPDPAFPVARLLELASGGWATTCYALATVTLSLLALGADRVRIGRVAGMVGIVVTLALLVIAGLSLAGNGSLAVFGPALVRPLEASWAGAVSLGLRAAPPAAAPPAADAVVT